MYTCIRIAWCNVRILQKKALTFVLNPLLLTATVLEGLFGEYHSSSAALGQQRPEVSSQVFHCHSIRIMHTNINAYIHTYIRLSVHTYFCTQLHTHQRCICGERGDGGICPLAIYSTYIIIPSLSPGNLSNLMSILLPSPFEHFTPMLTPLRFGTSTFAP